MRGSRERARGRYRVGTARPGRFALSGGRPSPLGKRIDVARKVPQPARLLDPPVGRSVHHRDRTRAGLAVQDPHARAAPVACYPRQMSLEALTIIGTGIALAILNVGLITWLRLDIKTDRAEAAADRRAFQQSMDGFRTEMRTFQTEMQRLAERQSRVQGALETTRSAAAAD